MPASGGTGWRLWGVDGGLRVFLPGELADGWTIVENPQFIRAALQRCVVEPSLYPLLVQLFEAAFGYRPNALADEKGLVLRRVLDAFRTGRLVVAREIQRQAAAAAGGASSPAIEKPERAPAPGKGSGTGPAPKPTKTWIEFQLCNSDDKPIPNERYRIKLTDGSTKEGRLDSHGKARFDGLDPGDCEIGFPDLDARDWAPA